MDRWMDRRTDRPYFVRNFSLPPGAQQSFVMIFDWYMKEIIPMRQLDQHVIILNTLQIFWKRIILGSLGMTDQTYKKYVASTCRKVWWLSACKKSTSSFPSFYWYGKHNENFILGTLGMSGYDYKNNNSL